jgi:S-adenosylmethionine:tRNA ribosyltransferase-isomerase
MTTYTANPQDISDQTLSSSVWQREHFGYDLPKERIAQQPLAQRSLARLLHVDARQGLMAHHVMMDLPQLLRRGDLLVINDTAVLKARLVATKSTGGRVALLLEPAIGQPADMAWAHLHPGCREGTVLAVGDARLTVLAAQKRRFLVQCSQPIESLTEEHGTVPLPPYIQRQPTPEDQARYQTVFARHKGSVAAPTAGLHLDDSLLTTLEQSGITTARLTLHVGAGTFTPLRHEDLSSHLMHQEYMAIPPELVAAIQRTRTGGGRVIAVGTTVVRALESAALQGTLQAGSGTTELFIQPGFRFRVIDGLLTNFHQPYSTLLVLVAAFAGYDTMRLAYQRALDCGYRFLSYGDAMLILPGQHRRTATHAL